MPSRGSGLATAVASTTLSPMRTTTEPWACLANFPVSNARLLPPVSCTDTSCFILISFWAGGHAGAGLGGCTIDDQAPVVTWDLPGDAPSPLFSLNPAVLTVGR